MSITGSFGGKRQRDELFPNFSQTGDRSTRRERNAVGGIHDPRIGELHATLSLRNLSGAHNRDHPCHTVCLESDIPYTIGRSTSQSQFIFKDSHISRNHCQFLFHGSLQKLYLLNRIHFTSDNTYTVSFVDEFRYRLVPKYLQGIPEDGKYGPYLTNTFQFRSSLNDLFVNGVRICEALVVELCAGDEVSLSFANSHINDSITGQISFIIQSITAHQNISATIFSGGGSMFVEPQDLGLFPSGHVNKRIFSLKSIESEAAKCNQKVICEAKSLISYCRHILVSDDPIYCLKTCPIPNLHSNSSHIFGLDQLFSPSKGDYNIKNSKYESNNNFLGIEDTLDYRRSFFCRDRENSRDDALESNKIASHRENVKAVDSCHAHLEHTSNSLKSLAIEKISNTTCINIPGIQSPHATIDDDRRTKYKDGFPGNFFYLNSLEGLCDSSFNKQNVVSLPELLYPLQSISRIFIATFTSDILWFLSYCQIPPNLPVTIACHNVKGWSIVPEERISVPFSDFPNLVVVNPHFPTTIAFGNDYKRQGIGCHHPKLIVLQREENIRVIISSANLVPKQWRNISNTIWWQDFPRLPIPDYLSIFTQMDLDKHKKYDFSSHLAGFMASLMVDMQCQAYWIIEITKYDFSNALGHLISSVPGVHSCGSPCMHVSEKLIHNHDVKFLGFVEASVVGLSHLYRTTDKNGEQLKKLAYFLSYSREKEHDLLETIVLRSKNIPADSNAVSIFVSNPNESHEKDFVQLGFLPKNVAKWFSPLFDVGFFRFSGFIDPGEALASASGENNMKVRLMLHVFQGPNFVSMESLIQAKHVTAICSLVASLQRCHGLWRLKEILGKYNWPENMESDFVYGASSVGSISTKFLADFASAAGKKSLHSYDSEETDPQWGGWNASNELRNPSMKIIFPSIEKVKSTLNEILVSKQILCFSEKTWKRVQNLNILCDFVAQSADRRAYPSHVKVARRRFMARDGESSGWVYCGSHNFSAAAWGRQVLRRTGGHGCGARCRLHVSNYELGIIFLFPPHGEGRRGSMKLDDITLPFVVPAPMYGHGCRPATKKAMKEAMALFITEADAVDVDNVEETAVDEDEDDEDRDEDEDEDEDEECVVGGDVEKEDDKAYADVLWSQTDDYPNT